MCVFANAVIGKSQSAALGVGNHTGKGKIKADFDVVNTILHEAFAFITVVGQLDRKSFGAPEHSFVAGLGRVKPESNPQSTSFSANNTSVSSRYA